MSACRDLCQRFVLEKGSGIHGPWSDLIGSDGVAYIPTMLMSDLSPLSLQTIAALTTHAAQIPTAMSEYINLFIRKLNRILWIGTPSHWGPKEKLPANW